jgi:hypothetical protein
MLLQNVGTHLPDYTVLERRRSAYKLHRNYSIFRNYENNVLVCLSVYRHKTDFTLLSVEASNFDKPWAQGEEGGSKSLLLLEQP